MKVNLITKHSSHNFGAMLQAYALQQTIKTIYDCKIIDYRPNNGGNKFKKINSMSNIVNNIFTLLFHFQLKKGYERFNDFLKKEYDLTQRYNSIEELYKNIPFADTYVCGSDQIWNPLALNEVYFLKFAPKKSKKVSYAASMGISYLPDKSIQVFNDYLKNIDVISVRESNAKEIIKPLTNREIYINVDPVFLLEKEIWKKIESPINIQKPYILCYLLYRPGWINKALKKLHKNTGLDIVVVTTDAYRNIYHNKIVRNAGPKEMIWLINHAEFVVSSSFHGVALSIVNQKPFFAVVNPDSPARIRNILDVFGLQEREISTFEDIVFKEIDYSTVEIKCLDERRKALNYLKENCVIRDEANL